MVLIALTPSISTLRAGPWDDLYEQAVFTSPIVAQIHADSLAWRVKESRQLNELFTFVSENPNKDESLKDDVRADLETDQAYFAALSEQMKPIKVGEQGMTYQMKTNKMELGASLALELLEDSFDAIVEGTLPHGYSISVPKVVTMGDEDHVYASGRGVALKHLLLRTAMRLSDVTIMGLGQKLDFDLKESPFVQYTPLPLGLDLEGLGLSPYYVGDDSKDFMAVIHNGYTFGGHRNETPKTFGPHDCSSFIANYVGCKPVATFHQATYYQLVQGFEFEGEAFSAQRAQWIIDKQKHGEDDYICSLYDTMTPVKIFDVSDVTPGMVHAERTYRGISENRDISLWGNGGHTSITLGAQGAGPDAKTITIGTNRDIEGRNRDGIFCLEARPFMTDPVADEKLVMYFNVKE